MGIRIYGYEFKAKCTCSLLIEVVFRPQLTSPIVVNYSQTIIKIKEPVSAAAIKMVLSVLKCSFNKVLLLLLLLLLLL